MPLKPGQIKEIEKSTEHFFLDLPTEEKALQDVIYDFKNAIANKLTDSHDLFFLQKCFHEPRLFLHGIEEKYSDITIGEVQSCLFDYTVRKLQAAVQAANTHWDAKAWSNLLQSIQRGEQFRENFVSLPMAIKSDKYGPNEVDTDGRMFTAKLVPRALFRLVQLEVGIKLEPERPPLTVALAEYPPELNFELHPKKVEEFDRKLISGDKGETIAETRAEKESIPIIMRDMIDQGSVLDEHVRIASRSAKKLMTWEFYHTRVSIALMFFDEIKQINEVQLKTLTSPAVMERIERDEYKLETVLAFTAAEREVVINPFYYAGIQSGQFDFERDFKGLNEQESVNLNCPAVMNLVKANNITIAQARSLTDGERKILSTEFYYNLMKMADQNAVKLFLNNAYVRFFLERDILKISDLAYLPQISFSTPEPLDALPAFNPETEKQVRKFVKNFLVYAAEDLLNESDLKILYDSLPDLFFSHEPPPVNLEEKGIDLFCRTLSKYNVRTRLCALFQDNPQILVNGKTDTFGTLIRSCRDFNIDIGKILDLEIEKKIHCSLLGDKDAMTCIRAHREALELNPFRLQSLYFTQRFLGVYQGREYCINGEKDTLSRIENDVLKMAEKQLIAPDHLHAAIMRRVLQLICKDVRKRFKDQSATPAIYRFTVVTVSLAEKAAAQKGQETKKLECWKKAFHDVVEHASLEKPVYQPPRSDVDQETKRQCTSPALFRPVSPGKIAEEVRKFCQWIGELSQTMTPPVQAKTLHITRRA